MLVKIRSFLYSFTSILSEELAYFDEEHGFDPRESIEKMTKPGLCVWDDQNPYVPVWIPRSS
ncbi:MAG: hypothetical protein ACXADY_04245 [Candidatus Hodarchaeales archaeon]|jgi:hypothetical protein